MPRIRPFKSLTCYSEAYSLLIEKIGGVDRTEIVGLAEADGRVVSEDMVASIPLPPYNRSGMDGFAVRAKDTYEATKLAPKKLRIIGRIFAGSFPEGKVGAGVTMSIATGAEMPVGADAVIPIEDTDVSGNVLRVYRGVHPNENVSKKGSDISEGTVVIKKGDVLNPRKIGMLAALGYEKVKVFQKPKVAILPTGSEILKPGSELRRGKVFDSNTHALSALAIENGCIPLTTDIVPDERKLLERAIEKALSQDIVIVSGGSSVGERDLIVDILNEKGNVLFHGVQIKPGKPFLCGTVRGKVVLGMPGYPAAFITVSYIFVLPALRKLANLPQKDIMSVEAILDTKLSTSLGRRQFVTVRLEKGRAVPVFKESGAISSLSEADGYIEIAENVDLVEKGERVWVKLFD